MANEHGVAVAQSTLLSGSFASREDAELAFDSLVHRGYAPTDIGVMMSENARKQLFTVVTADTPLASRAAEGGAAGAAVGGLTGAIVGLVASATLIALPGIGIVFAGPLVAGLVGLGAGGAAGGLIGTLIGAGIPEEHAKVYETDLNNGRIILAVTPHSDEDATALRTEWSGFRGTNILR